MAWERPVLDLPGIIAGEDFSSVGALTGLNATGQFLFVKMTPSQAAGVGSLSVVHCNNHKDRPLGISQGNSKTGQALQVRAIGISKVVAGEPLSPTMEIGTDGAGRAVHKNPTSTGADYGDYVAGCVLEGVAAAGSVATVLVGMPYRI